MLRPFTDDCFVPSTATHPVPRERPQSGDSVEKVENCGFLIFPFGTKDRKPPLNLLALTHRRFRVTMIKDQLPPRPKFRKPPL